MTEFKVGDRVRDKYDSQGVGTVLGPDPDEDDGYYEVRFDDFKDYDDSEITDCHTRKADDLELVGLAPGGFQHEGVDWHDHLQEWEDRLKAKKAQEDDFYARVEYWTTAIREMLVEKNAKYGDVALNPIHIFSPWDSANALKVRIDDKLARMRSLGERDDEDTVKDLIGYLVLYQIAKGKKAEEQK
jgi:hypothetical protein